MRPSMDSEIVEQQAAQWLARRLGDTWTAADEAERDAWLERRTAHRVAYIRLEAAWQYAARLQALGVGVPQGVVPSRGAWDEIGSVRCAQPQTHPPPSRQTRAAHTQPRFVRLSLFALAATVLMFAVGLHFTPAVPFLGTSYSTPVGGMANLPLADGSRLILNTDTHVRVKYSARERRILLERGEAFFEVAKDKTRPFVVYAGENRVVAVGTKFSVRRDRGDVQVIVTEGRVNLAASVAPARLGPGTPRTVSAEPVVGPVMATAAVVPLRSLTAGMIARSSKDEVVVRRRAAAEAEALLSWRSGYVVFDDVSLADAVAEFNRYIERKIVIEDRSLAGLHIGGNFRSNNADAFLWLLQNGFQIEVERSADKIVLKHR